MKRNNDIALLFQKHEAKVKKAAAERQNQKQGALSYEEIEEPDQLEQHIVLNMSDGQREEQESLLICDVNSLEHDPRLRMPIASYDVNDQNATRIH